MECHSFHHMYKQHKINSNENGAVCVSQETRIRAAEKDPQSKAQNICITNQYGGEEVTHTLSADSREDTQHWMEAFWQQFYDMSECSYCQCTKLNTNIFLNFRILMHVCNCYSTKTFHSCLET